MLTLEVSHAAPRRMVRAEHRCAICGAVTPRSAAWPHAIPAACPECLDLLAPAEAEVLRIRANGTSSVGHHEVGEERYMRWIALALLSDRDLDRAMRSWPEDVRALQDIRSGATADRVLRIRGVDRITV